MTPFNELLETNSIVRAIYEECQSPKPMTPDFCAYQFWHATLKSSGKVGALFLIRHQVAGEFQSLVETQCRLALPACAKGEACECRSDYDVEPPTTEPGMYSLE